MLVTSTHSCDTPQCFPDIAKCPSGGPGAVHERARGGEPLNQLMPLLCGGLGVPHGQPVTQGSGAKAGQTPQNGFGLRAPPPPPPVQSSPGVGPASASSVARSQLMAVPRVEDKGTGWQLPSLKFLLSQPLAPIHIAGPALLPLPWPQWGRLFPPTASPFGIKILL